MSRLYGGIHYTFDNETGLRAGIYVGQKIRTAPFHSGRFGLTSRSRGDRNSSCVRIRLDAPRFCSQIKSTVRSGGMRRLGPVAAARSLANLLLYEVLDFAVLVFPQLEVSRSSNHLLQLILRHSSRPALLSQVEDPEGRRLRGTQRAVVATAAMLLDQLAHPRFERIDAWMYRIGVDERGSHAGEEKHRAEAVRIQCPTSRAQDDSSGALIPSLVGLQTRGGRTPSPPILWRPCSPRNDKPTSPAGAPSERLDAKRRLTIEWTSEATKRLNSAA